jgi:hypothetical protein
MNHTDALNKILSNCCPVNNPSEQRGEFLLDLHCAKARVVADSNQDWDDERGYVTYNIVSVNIERG